MPNTNPRLALTPGEPAGIGADILLKLATMRDLSNIVVFADRELLKTRAEILGLSVQLHESFSGEGTHQLIVHHIPLRAPAIPGQLNVENAPYVLETLTFATQACLKNELQGLVTGPVHKSIINEAGIPFKGHTEFLAELTKTPRTVMMLANTQLRVCLLTTHIPLRLVADQVTSSNLEECILIIHSELKNKFKILNPRIGVCGLNPHAGEDGHIGTEEQTIITPTLEKLRAQGMHLIGPISADTAFVPEKLKAIDVMLTMYHDQGLPVIKAQGFGETVNITLGLPIIRTSVDHGTALDLAGKGQADPSSLNKAIQMALQIVGNPL